MILERSSDKISESLKRGSGDIYSNEYWSCYPLKKRRIKYETDEDAKSFISNSSSELPQADEFSEPENLSTKPQDLRDVSHRKKTISPDPPRASAPPHAKTNAVIGSFTQEITRPLDPTIFNSVAWPHHHNFFQYDQIHPKLLAPPNQNNSKWGEFLPPRNSNPPLGFIPFLTAPPRKNLMPNLADQVNVKSEITLPLETETTRRKIESDDGYLCNPVMKTHMTGFSGGLSTEDRNTVSRSSCDSGVSSPSGSSSHSTMSTESRGPTNARYQCTHCAKSYSTVAGLSKHIQFHCTSQVTKTYVCKDCNKVYTSLGALKMHIRTHTLPCKCTLCPKSFSRPWLLQGHLRTHTGEKPFGCEHCRRAFADRSNLRAHLQTHSQVKKYSCNRCAKTFSRVSLLSKHEESGCSLISAFIAG